MKFYIQDPIFPGTYSLHEALLEACNGVKYGAGVFAFVTKGGVNLFLGDQIFQDFIKYKGKFKLIIGIDEITNTRTLKKLDEMLLKYGNSLEVLVFMHNHKSTTFHPKFTWFRKETGGVLIVGSNNLTEKGLRRNIEAFNYVELNDTQINEIEIYFNNWLVHNEKYLFDIHDEDVIERAKQNERIVIRNKKTTDKINDIDEGEEIFNDESEDIDDIIIETSEQNKENIIDDDDFEAWDFLENNEVLVAQIPKSGSRWSQANFDKNTFQTFFGAQAGQNGVYRIILRSVNSSGKLGEIEIRPSVSVASQNYRFELDAAIGLAYPTPQRPIAVFIKVAVRMYLYVLAMPTDTFYNELDNYIDHFKGTKMVRYIVDVNDIKSKCPNLPLWNIKK
ncbi:phospholipase D family protein [Clostridium aestuarii]|uniref:Phospholipase D family protein n=1 Tax=Clostridium aestuarii TaxID=338193 RepID=A0ABT4D5M1_9CLOT|nr:phospholipase D family protein [Clostridium aestuarii]MCY6485333.1 phospholipase D family protein [Clostridium aestuarii]